MADKRDAYEILGVSRTASPEDIKKAYRNLARKYHPDVYREADADERFKEINEAYEILSDPEKRGAYDRYGYEAMNGPSSGPGGFAQAGFGDIFDLFFGGGGRHGGRAAAMRGDDLQHELEITLEEAARGAPKSIRYSRLENCDICSGSGARPGTDAETCPTCRGAGQVRQLQNTLLGTFETSQPCGRCRGEGRIVASPCTQCAGNGRVRKSRERALRIPPGVDTGSRIRLNGEGDAGMRGAEAGDLYILLKVQPHELFERRNLDLFCEVPITFAQAALGATISVPLIDGEENLTIPEGTQTGRSFRLKMRGIPEVNGRAMGDQHVIVRVQVPTRLTHEQKRLIEQLAQSLGDEHDPPAHEKGFFGRLFGN